MYFFFCESVTVAIHAFSGSRDRSVDLHNALCRWLRESIMPVAHHQFVCKLHER
jgi:hypothetical protein